jgi:hypothetical protein
MNEIDYIDPQDTRHASTLRMLLHFIAVDLGVEDHLSGRHAVELAQEIRKEIAKRKAAPALYDALVAFTEMWGSRDAHSESKASQRKRAAMWDKANAALATARGKGKPHATLPETKRGTEA